MEDDVSSSMGHALRRIVGGPVEVMLRVQDFALRADVEKQIGGSGQECVAFAANDFREIGDTDVWSFDVTEAQAGNLRRLNVYVMGSDIFMVRVDSKLAL
jgi:hypothetical protein